MSRHYRTEILIPADRVVVLHLPDDIPPGPAVVRVEAGPPAAEADPEDVPFEGHARVHEDDRQDIEWWDHHAEPGPHA